MPIYLKQSTASQAVLLGPFVDDTDGATAETGLTIANTDIRLSKAGGNMVAKNSGGGTHDENGWYTITLDATDTNTVGTLQISCKVAGALAVWLTAHVFEESIYDALFGASAAGFDSNQRVDVGEWLGTAVTTSATTAKPEVDAFSVSDNQAAADNVQANIGNLDAAISGLNDISTAQVNTEVDTALSDIGLDHLVSAAVTGTDVTDNSIIARLVSSSATADWDDFANTTDSLQALRDHIGDGTNLTEAGGTGNHLTACLTATGFSTHSAADVWTSGTRTLTAATNITSDGNAITMSSSGVVGTVNVVNTTTTNTDMLTAAAVNAEVVDVVNVDTLVAGQSMAEALRRIGAVTSYKLSGAGTGTETVTDWADSASTIVFTVDASGNKSAITFN